jgi:hypothetical protein
MDTVESGFSKASEINRNDLLEYKEEKQANKRVPLVLTYHPPLEKISGIVRHHWKEIDKSIVKEVNHIRCFAIHIAKYIMLLSYRLAMEHLCVHSLDDFGRSQIYITDHNPSWKENQRQN